MNIQFVSVIISTYNRPKALDLVLRGLANQSPRPAQIIIADDGSGSETHSVIKRWRSDGLPIDHCWQENLGFRKTIVMNQAISRVQAPYVIFLDGDCIPLQSFIADHLNFAVPKTVLAGTRTLAFQPFTKALESGVEHCVHKGFGYWLGKGLSGSINRIFPILRLPDGPWRSLQPHRWQLVRGCNFSLFKDDLLATGGFDETILGWGREDSELAIRLVNSGLRVKFLAYAAPVLHLWHEEQTRSKLAVNNQLMQQTLTERRTRARVTSLRADSDQ